MKRACSLVLLMSIATAACTTAAQHQMEANNAIEARAPIEYEACLARLRAQPSFELVGSLYPDATQATDLGRLSNTRTISDVERPVIFAYQTAMFDCRDELKSRYSLIDPTLNDLTQRRFYEEDAVFSRLMAGAISWGEATRQMAEVRRAANKEFEVVRAGVQSKLAAEHQAERGRQQAAVISVLQGLAESAAAFRAQSSAAGSAGQPSP